MASSLLYDRIVKDGTLAEQNGVPEPIFALPATINWMHALTLLVKNQEICFASATQFYNAVRRRSAFSNQEENTILEQLFFALHQLSALNAFRSIPCCADTARMGIVTWYYGIYNAASAMIAAQDGSTQDNHAGTANSWDRQFSQTNLILPPFGLRVSSLIDKNVRAEISAIRAGKTFDLKSTASTPEEAIGACCSYLSGTASYYRWRTEEEVRLTRGFKELNVNDFRTKDARRLRDERLAKRSVSFMHQAFRYRGKANYREALFLGYGADTNKNLTGYIDNLYAVLSGFLSMAGAFASRRLSKNLWEEFVDDVEKKRAFSLSPMTVWK